MGGPRIRRWDGVKQAINAIVNDTTLTTGAHFGFGHWNAGESGGGKNSARGGRYCHFNLIVRIIRVGQDFSSQVNHCHKRR